MGKRSILTALFFLGTILTTSNLLIADSQGYANAEKRRIEEQIQQKKLDQQRQEQKIIDRKQEDRRLEQQRLDRKRYDRNEVAIRDGGGRSSMADEDRNQNALNQMMDVHSQIKNQFRSNDQYTGNANYNDNGTNGEDTNQDCELNCCDTKFIRRMESEDRCQEQSREHRIEVVEQWDRDHSRD